MYKMYNMCNMCNTRNLCTVTYNYIVCVMCYNNMCNILGYIYNDVLCQPSRPSKSCSAIWHFGPSTVVNRIYDVQHV